MAEKIIIVGAGIVGASIAYHLAKRGADVTVLEAALPGSGASSKSFGWINASFAQTPEYFTLRRAAIEAFRGLCDSLDLSSSVRWHGSLWWEDEGDAFDTHVAALGARGYEAVLFDAARFHALEPAVADAPARCLHTPVEAAADGYGVTQALLAGAAAKGARILSGCAVNGFEREGTQIVAVRSALGTLHADQIVIAAGTGAGDLLGIAGAQLPMDNKHGLIVHTLPVAPVIRHLILSPDIHFKQETDGRIVMGEIFSGGDLSQGGLDTAQELAAGMLMRLKRRLPSVDGLQIGQVMMGLRPVPADGLPAVGAVPGAEGLYVVSTHSGVTLAPLLGQLVADELFGRTSEMLATFRPDRFM